MPLQTGDKAPTFTLPGNGETSISLEDYKGKNVVLYFYPKDDTPGCTTEAKDFTSATSEFADVNTIVIGMSKDTVAKHNKFIAKHELEVLLASDEDGKVIEDYGVWVEKNMYGKKYMGIERSTFIILADGTIAEAWRKVKVKGHAQSVLEALDTILNV